MKLKDHYFKFFLRFSACCLLICLTGKPLCAQTNAEQVLTIGKNVLSMEDYMLAIQYFNQAIKAKPYLSEPYFFRAIAKLSLDDYEGAEEDCSLAIERNKFKTEAYKVRGFARQVLGKDSLALEDYDEGLKYNPLDKQFLFYKAVALTELDKYEQADSTFSVLLRQYPTFEDGFTARARLNLEKNDTVSALDDLAKAISISKSQINPYLIKAQIEWQRKNWNEAGEAIDAAIRLKPDVADLYINRAFIRYNSDDFIGAMNDYNYALELEPYNTSALFNRALLRYEVKDLERAEADFTEVLNIDPKNFHALFNRGLVRLDADKNKAALSDFENIAEHYPRFYPVYYAMAEAERNLGNMRMAMSYVRKADDLVDKYLDNPEKNPLDRPAIAAAESNEARNSASQDETQEDVMDKFNRLVTISHSPETQLTYNEKIKGRVQDRDVNVEPEPLYAISFSDSPESLKSTSNYFRELDDLNQRSLINEKFYLTPGLPSVGEEHTAQWLFSIAEDFTDKTGRQTARPVDRLALGVVYTMLKNYPEALNNLDYALSQDPDFIVARMARGFTRYQQALVEMNLNDNSSEETEKFFDRRLYASMIQEAVSDFDMILAQDPGLVFAWFNKGNIHYGVGDYSAALQCFSQAISIDPSFGSAYFNRGLSYLRLGNRQQAFADLSKAGELGVLPSYNVLKRMK